MKALDVNADELVGDGDMLRIPTRPTEELRIRLSIRPEDGTRTYRMWIWWSDAAGEWHPTRRGWRGTLGIVDLERIAAALTVVATAARASRGAHRARRKVQTA